MGSSPHSRTWYVGNILLQHILFLKHKKMYGSAYLPAFVTIISVPNSLNSSQSGFISSWQWAVVNL